MSKKLKTLVVTAVLSLITAYGVYAVLTHLASS